MKDVSFPPGVVWNRAGAVGILKWVPRDVRAHPDWAGKTIVERSTGTCDRAEGLRRAMRMLIELEDQWAECRRQLGGALVPLDTNMLPEDVAEFADQVDTMVAAEFAADPDDRPKGGEPMPADPAGLVQWAAREIGYEPAPDMLPVLREAVAARLANQPPANEHQRYAAEAAARLAPRPKRRPRRTLDDLIALFEVERLEGGKARRASNYTTATDVLREVVGGGTVLDHIDRDDLRAVRDAILARPLAPASQRKYVRAAATIFGLAVDEGWLPANPALGLAPQRQPKEDEGARRPFTAAELAALFPDAWRLDTAADWMLALGLFQGLRAEEAAQLETSDVERAVGVWVIHVRAWTPTADGGRSYASGKHLKNPASERTLPIHSRIEPALIALADARRAAGERLLLPGVKRWGKEGCYGSVRKDVAARLTAAGVKTERTSHHSLRHNFRDACRAAGIAHGHALALGGWALGKGAEAGYGEGYTPATLKSSIDLLAYPSVGAGPILIEIKGN